MILPTKIIKQLSTEDQKREKRIIEKLKIEKLPFKIPKENFCELNVDIIKHFKNIFKFQNNHPGLKWCLSTIKKFKVFILIFESNELGVEIYKESLSNKLPEYSYKTIAQIVDEGIEKGFFIKLSPRLKKTEDLKIRNIRPSEDLIVEFINWNIDLITSLSLSAKKFK
jgi:hypothetical protein